MAALYGFKIEFQNLSLRALSALSARFLLFFFIVKIRSIVQNGHPAVKKGHSIVLTMGHVTF
jgi:hypothetical protein